MEKIDIFWGQILSVNEEGAIISVLNSGEKAFCSWRNITDISENREKLTEIGAIHRYCKLKVQSTDANDPLWVSYKYIHPEELLNKHKIIPTATHFRSLHFFLKQQVNSVNELISEDDLLFVVKFKDLYLNFSKK